jgi:hypothetical protein
MEKSSNLKFLLFAIFLFGVSNAQQSGFEDGKFFIINSVASSKVLGKNVLHKNSNTHICGAFIY